MLYESNVSFEGDNNVFLMAEDNPIDAELFSEMLNKAFDGMYSVICVDRFESIIDALNKGNFQALILDMDLPDRSGVENVHRLRKRFPTLPIVVLTGNEDLNIALDSLQNGAQDYLSKNNVTPEMLARSLHYARERQMIEQKLKCALEESAYKNLQLEAQSKHDPLTGLGNRTFFQDVGERVLLRAQRKNTRAALLYFDLNEFKKINDVLGHMAGDELLRQVSKRLKTVVRNTDFLARVGGDEFVIITDTLNDKEEVYPLVNRIKHLFDEDFTLGSHKVSMTVSIGVAFFPEASNFDLLVKHADCAMYEAKSTGTTSACFFSDTIEQQYARAQKIESLLRYGIEQQEITAHFQPVINIHNEKDIHVEALARWHNSELGFVRPDEFIPIAERSQAISGITKNVTLQSKLLFEQLAKRHNSSYRIAINVSANQLSHKNFCSSLLHWLDDFHLAPQNICIELTERQFVQNFDICKQQFEQIGNAGIQIALDDFGSGFSSVTHLIDLPFDVLKLDRVLIKDIDQNPRNQALVAGIIEMAKRLNMEIVAEGIETEGEKRIATELGCHYLQGYFISKPLPLEETVDFYNKM